ncbi:MAG TPA: hypothetical protein VF433_00380, partial [Cellvibrio sp.]
VKAGDTRVFPLLGFAPKPSVTVSDITLDKQKIAVGDTLAFNCQLTGGKQSQNLVVDYLIYFMKSNGKVAPKVFKLKNITLAPKEVLTIAKQHSFKPITTRRYYAGAHQLAIQVNGKEVARTDFTLQL